MNRRKSRRARACLIGMGNNSADHHTRMTRGDGFMLQGGDSAAHERMQAKAAEFMQRVRDRGLSMESITRNECREILVEIGMQVDDNARV